MKVEEKEKALLIGVSTKNQMDFQESMDELKNLAEACEMFVAGVMLFILPTILVLEKWKKFVCF